MDKITCEQLPEFFEQVAAIFAENKDLLCEMDAAMGDGDLGLTMEKGYGALPQLIRDNGCDEIGKTLLKAGMKMASVVPSTMGTLMSSGVMTGGKALAGKTEIGPEELAAYFKGFAEGIQKRGKCERGDRTVLDAVFPAAEAAEQAAKMGSSLSGVMEAALNGAKAGVEATKDMLPKYGKAAVFRAKAKGVADQGAVAGALMIEGMSRYISR